jgi:hypothetical protein
MLGHEGVALPAANPPGCTFGCLDASLEDVAAACCDFLHCFLLDFGFPFNLFLCLLRGAIETVESVRVSRNGAMLVKDGEPSKGRYETSATEKRMKTVR